MTWARLSKASSERLVLELTKHQYKAKGKNTNKDEFVTAGGVALEDLSTPEMEALKIPGTCTCTCTCT